MQNLFFFNYFVTPNMTKIILTVSDFAWKKNILYSITVYLRSNDVIYVTKRKWLFVLLPIAMLDQGDLNIAR